MTDEYILDTCIIIELLKSNPKTVQWLEDNKESVMCISGWTIIELMKEKKSKTEMEESIRKLSQWRILWNRPEFSDEIPNLLKEHFHSQRDNVGKLKGNCIFDVCIYITSKSNGDIPIVTRDGDFNFIKDVQVLNLQKDPKYKI